MSFADEVRLRLDEEEKTLLEIKSVISNLKEKVIDKTPHKFSKKDIINSIFGSLTVGLTFVFKGAILRTVKTLNIIHIEFIILATFAILIAEIYFVAYSRVKEKSQRNFGEFMTKRLFTLYFVSILSSFFLIYIFNIDAQFANFKELMKLVIALSMACSVGAAIPSVLKR